MFILPPPAAEVKPATPAPFALALPTELDFIEADARDMFDELTDEELDAMADEAAARSVVESGLCWL
jgi:hypothetical protein